MSASQTKSATRRKIAAPTAATAATMAQIRTAPLSPVRTWAFSAKYRSQPRIPSTHRRRTAGELPAPHRAEQESDTERNGERRVGSGLERFVHRVDHLVAGLLHGVDGFLPLGADSGNGVLDVRFRAVRGGGAFGREDVGDL